MPLCFCSTIKACTTCHANVVSGSSEKRWVHTQGPAGPHDGFKGTKIWRGLEALLRSKLLTGQDGLSISVPPRCLLRVGQVAYLFLN